MKYLIFGATLFLLLSGCSSKTEPSEKNFAAAISAYLEKKGELCLSAETWPIDVPVRELRMESRSSDATRMSAMKDVGLVASSVQEIETKSWDGKPSGRKTKVTRYALTEKGMSFFRPDAVSTSAKPDERRGSLCYGQKALDKIVKWDGPIKLGDYQEAGVKYLYKIDDLAEWAKDEKIQTTYPSIKYDVDGIGKTQQSHGVKITSIGWEANGIDS